jgi:hypothetical protein
VVVAAPDAAGPERVVRHDVAEDLWTLEVDPRYGWTRSPPDGLEFAEEARDSYRIRGDGPLSARARSHWTVRLHRPDPAWDVRISASSETGADAAHLLTDNQVTAEEGGTVLFHRRGERRIPRTQG